MKNLTVELEKLSKKLTTGVEKLRNTWKQSGALLGADLSPVLEGVARDLSGQVQDLIGALPGHLTRDLQPLLGDINPTNLPQVLDQLQATVFNPNVSSGLAGIFSTALPGTGGLAPLSDIAVIEDCFGNGINASCIASGALGAFGTLRDMQSLIPGNIDQAIGKVFSNIGNPGALLGSLPNQLLGPLTDMANSVVGTFGSGIAGALGNLANPQMLGSVFGGLSSVMGSITSSVEGLLGGLTGSLSGVMGSLQDVVGNVFGGLSSVTDALGNLTGMLGNLGGMLGGFLDPGGLLGGFDIGGILGPGIDPLFAANIDCFGCW